MVLSFFLSNKSSSSKDLVVSVLSREWPLSAKEIFSRVRKDSKVNLSYQAVHKVILLLVKEGVVAKKEGKYLISSVWADSLFDFSQSLKKNLSSGEEVFPLTRELVFSSVYEIDKFLADFAKTLKPTKDDSFALHWHHLWIPLFFSKDTYKEMRNLIVGANYYCVCPADTPIDRWCQQFWHKLGVREKIGVKGIPGVDMVIFRDIIIQVFYPPEIKEAIDNVYSSTKDPSKLDIDEFFKTVFEKKCRIPVLISRNEAVANELFEQTKSFFS
jgi:hypothetical protein